MYVNAELSPIVRRGAFSLLLLVLTLPVACASREPAGETLPGARSRAKKECLSRAEIASAVARHEAIPSELVMKKLDPDLRTLARQIDRSAQPAAPAQATPAGSAARAEGTPEPEPCVPPRIGIVVEFGGALADLEAFGFQPMTVLEHPSGSQIAEGLISPARLVELAAIPHVVVVEGARAYMPELDYSVPEIGAHASQCQPVSDNAPIAPIARREPLRSLLGFYTASRRS